VDAVAHIPIADGIIIVSAQLTFNRGPELILICFQLTGGRGYLEKILFRIILPQTAAVVDVVISAPPTIALTLVVPTGPRSFLKRKENT